MNINGQEENSLSEKKDILAAPFNDRQTIKIENSYQKNREQNNILDVSESNRAEKSDGRISINRRVEYSSTKTLAAQDLPPSERLKSAINRYRYQAQLNPDSAIVQTNLGKLYHKNQQFAEAIRCYQKAIAIDKSYSLAHQYLAQIPTDKVSE